MAFSSAVVLTSTSPSFAYVHGTFTPSQSRRSRRLASEMVLFFGGDQEQGVGLIDSVVLEPREELVKGLVVRCRLCVVANISRPEGTGLPDLSGKPLVRAGSPSLGCRECRKCRQT